MTSPAPWVQSAPAPVTKRRGLKRPAVRAPHLPRPHVAPATVALVTACLAIMAVVILAIYLAAGGISPGAGSPLLEFPTYDNTQLQSSQQSTSGTKRVDDRTYREPRSLMLIQIFYETALNTAPWAVVSENPAGTLWSINRTDNAGGSGVVTFSSTGANVTTVHVRYTY